jgi:multicomponent Na+:H+ antiporter subunit B
VLLPLMLLFSFFILIRGHSEPGGGFIAGLIASAAMALYAIAHDVERAREAMRINTRMYVAIGLIIAFISGLFPLLLGRPFMTMLLYPYGLPVLGQVGNAFTFDVGVFLVVVGVTLSIIFAMAEEEET